MLYLMPSKAWWLSAITSTDRDGQSPLHYIAANEALNSSDLLREMMTAGRGVFQDNKITRSSSSGRKHCETVGIAAGCNACVWFRPNTLYSTVTGHEIGSSELVSASSIGPDSSPFTSTLAEPKSSSSSAHSESLFTEQQGVRGGLSIPNEAPINFEIIVPWLLRNMHKRAMDLDLKETQPDRTLKELTISICKDNSYVLIAPELRELLARLGIRVTADVIREVCRLYAADHDIVRRKWMEALEKAAKASSEGGGREEKGINSRSDSKGGDSSSSRHGQAFDKYAKASGSSGDTKEHAGAVLTGEEEDLGVDMKK